MSPRRPVWRSIVVAGPCGLERVRIGLEHGGARSEPLVPVRPRELVDERAEQVEHDRANVDHLFDRHSSSSME